MYQFIKKDEDTTILKYKDKEFEIKRDVELQSKLQGIYNSAETKMYIDLSKQGVSADSLIIKTIKNGKTYEDTSNLTRLENRYVQLEQTNLFQEISKEIFGMSLEELMFDIGLDSTSSTKFGEEFGKALTGTGKTPSQK